LTCTVVVPARQFVAAQMPQLIVPDVMSTTLFHVWPALSNTAVTLWPEVSELNTTLMSSRFPAVVDVTLILPVDVSLLTVLTRTTFCTWAGGWPDVIAAVPLATDVPVADTGIVSRTVALPDAADTPVAVTT
jgi:hypothetical protein